MVDEVLDRNYQSGRGALNRDIDRGFAAFFASLRAGYTRLNRIQWSAPWQPGPAPRRAKRTGMA